MTKRTAKKTKAIPFEEIKKELFKDPAFRVEYDALAGEFEIAAAIIKARLKAGLTQAQLAKKMGTSQAHIARLESGNALPSLATLYKFGAKLGLRPKITFLPIGD
jgi:ribosome-binding protein aMBF1 (putative translation factor)